MDESPPKKTLKKTVNFKSETRLPELTESKFEEVKDVKLKIKKTAL